MNKTVLVTGGLGFIGSHYVDYLLQRGYNVVNVDKVTYASNPELNEEWNKKYPENYQFIKKDIAELEELPYCDYIVHFAAESHVDNSIRDGLIFTNNNVVGTQKFLNLVIQTLNNNLAKTWKSNPPLFLYISTDEVFGDIEKGYFKEDDAFKPSNPYAASKAAAELVVVAYNRTYGLPYIITRTTNNYGPRQHPEKLVPHSITSALKGEKIKVHGSGKQIRNWIHVKDNCAAIYKIMTNGKRNENYHISSDEEFSVNEVAQVILEAMGKKIGPETIMRVQDRAGQDVRYALDSSKTKKLNWKPEHNFKTEIKNIIEDYKK